MPNKNENLSKLSKLNKLKAVLGVTNTAKDNYLITLIEMAEQEAESYTGQELEKIPESVVVEMAVFKFNRLNTIGVNAENYSGVSFNYAEDYPESIVRELKRIRKVVFL